MQFAHRNLVVHRDLKPSNILVAADGTVKLVDFGIATLLRDDHRSAPGTLTVPGWEALTPDYASPEQLMGRPVSTASDVYSLGVVLYTLLAGRHPFDVEQGKLSEVMRVVVEDAPPPSLAATDEAAERMGERTAARLRKRLEGELDNIVLMAIRKEPERRYASPERLADDIRRHLDGRPVLA